MNPYSSHYSLRMTKPSNNSVSHQSGRSEAASTRDIRKDLLALGIDLDETLIERMSRNLGISTTFESVAKASTVVRERTKVEENVDITYRNVSETPEKPPASPSKLSKSQFQTSPQKAFQLLRQLESRSGLVDPQIRVALTKLVAAFRISYNRNPSLFIRRLLHLRKGRVSDNIGKQDPHLEILQNRYMDEQMFIAAVQRLAKDITAEVASALFHHLVEKKAFGHIIKSVVDLCLFISMLQGEDVTRRSYDFGDTFVAHDVEFWNLRRAPNPNGPTNSPVKKVTKDGDRLTSVGSFRQSLLREGTNHPIPDRRSSAYGVSSNNEWKSCTHDSVSSLLGKNLPQHISGESSGRKVMGSIHLEHKRNNTKVATALNSVLSDSSGRPRPSSAPPLRPASRSAVTTNTPNVTYRQNLGKWLESQYENS